jgi:hypothetical protein
VDAVLYVDVCNSFSAGRIWCHREGGDTWTTNRNSISRIGNGSNLGRKKEGSKTRHNHPHKRRKHERMNNLDDDLSRSSGIPPVDEDPMRIDVSGLELNAEGARGVVGGGVAAAAAEHSVDGATSSRAPARSRAGDPQSETSDDVDNDDRKPSAGISKPSTNDVLLGRGGE